MARDVLLWFVCRNPACREHGYPVKARAFEERGRTYLYDDVDGRCPHCESELQPE